MHDFKCWSLPILRISDAYQASFFYATTSILENCVLFMRTAQAQDYIFVKEFVPFVASVLLNSCRQSDDTSDMEIILGGVASLSDELSWFKTEASRWDVELTGVSPLKANIEYCR